MPEVKVQAHAAPGLYLFLFFFLVTTKPFFSAFQLPIGMLLIISGLGLGVAKFGMQTGCHYDGFLCPLCLL